MGVFSGLFGHGKKLSMDFMEFQKDTELLIRLSIKLIKKEREGGFVKIIFAGKDSEFCACLTETHLCRDMKVYNNDIKKCLMSLYNWNEEHEVDTFLNMTKLFIEDQDAFATKIDFVHFYGKVINPKDGIKWVSDFMKANYPDYKVEVRSDSVYFVC